MQCTRKERIGEKHMYKFYLRPFPVEKDRTEMLSVSLNEMRKT